VEGKHTPFSDNHLFFRTRDFLMENSNKQPGST